LSEPSHVAVDFVGIGPYDGTVNIDWPPSDDERDDNAPNDVQFEMEVKIRHKIAAETAFYCASRHGEGGRFTLLHNNKGRMGVYEITHYMMVIPPTHAYVRAEFKSEFEAKSDE